MFDKIKVEEFYPGAGGLMLEPQLIHKATDDQLKKCDDGTWFGQLKKDGALYMYVKGTNGENYLFGRTVSKKTGLLTEKAANVPHIIEAFDNIPNGTIILGEIYYPGKTSKDVVSIMGCLPQKAIERQKGAYGYIHYYIYDCLCYDNKSLLKYDNWTRYQVIKRIYIKNISKSNTIDLAAVTTENLYQTVGQALAAGEEGMVFKKKTALYEPGKRPQTMLKAKQVDYIDAFIIGFEDPTVVYSGKEIKSWQYWVNPDNEEKYPVGCYYDKYITEEISMFYVPVTKHYYYGWKNAIEIGAYDTNSGNIVSIGTIASGLTDELRKDFAENPDKYFNRVVSIQCMSKDNKEKTLRHGFFVKFHDEKQAKDCKLEDIFS